MEDRRHSGFTLAELLITLAIVALLAGIAVPAMTRQLDATRLRAASEALVQELRQARSHAIKHRRTVYFSIATLGRDWCFGWSQTDTSCAAASPRQRHGYRQSSREFPAVQIHANRSTGVHTLRFTPLRGMATAASISLQSRYAELKVIVSPLGRVRLCSPTGQGYLPC